jgi:hypothetical protein
MIWQLTLGDYIILEDCRKIAGLEKFEETKEDKSIVWTYMLSDNIE